MKGSHVSATMEITVVPVLLLLLLVPTCVASASICIMEGFPLFFSLLSHLQQRAATTSSRSRRLTPAHPPLSLPPRRPPPYTTPPLRGASSSPARSGQGRNKNVNDARKRQTPLPVCNNAKHKRMVSFFRTAPKEKRVKSQFLFIQGNTYRNKHLGGKRGDHTWKINKA